MSSPSKRVDVWYVYVDYTKETEPRPFYVGKGDGDRLKNLKRNLKHANVSTKHGLDRHVVFETLEERAAFDEEKRLIAHHRTYAFADDAVELACNFTLGGEGTAGINRVPVQVTWPDGTTKLFPSTKDAALELGVASPIVGRAIDGKRSSTINGATVKRIEFRPRVSKTVTLGFNQAQVEELRDGVVYHVYPSIGEAATSLGVTRVKLSAVLNGRLDVMRFAASVSRVGHTWKRTTPHDRGHLGEGHRVSIATALRGKPKSPATRAALSAAKSRPVVELCDGKVVRVFPSLKAACTEMNIGKTVAYRLMKEGSLAWEDVWRQSRQ